MSDGRGRLFGGIAALAVLWIVVYWWWEPRGATISFDPGPASADAGTGSLVDSERPRVVEPRGASPVVQEPVAVAPRPTPPPAPPVVKEEPRPPVPAVIPPQFREYAIRDGDTLEAIARRELGSSRHVEAILAANPLMSPDRLTIGRVIKLPIDPKNIQGKPNPDAPVASSPVTKAIATEYTVKSGDSLSKIAREVYGSTAYDELIFQANRDQLNSKDDLQIGQKLKLPPKEER